MRRARSDRSQRCMTAPKASHGKCSEGGQHEREGERSRLTEALPARLIEEGAAALVQISQDFGLTIERPPRRKNRSVCHL